MFDCLTVQAVSYYVVKLSCLYSLGVFGRLVLLVARL